jgi:hypothetical protein
MALSLAWHKDATVIFRLSLWAMTTDDIFMRWTAKIDAPCRSGALVMPDVLLG